MPASSIEPHEPYQYPETADASFVPSWNGWDRVDDAAGPPSGGKENAASEIPDAADFERRLGEEKRRAFEAGRARGMDDGREADRAADAKASASTQEKQIRQAAEFAEEFGRQRERYFMAIEQEVVKLALAVAARILRREAQTDPLLLMGAVRVALGQLAASTEVRLRVPPADLNLWTEAIALLPHHGTKPSVLAGEGMTLGECRIETALGNADLGLPGQLVEMESSLFEHRESGKRQGAGDVAAADREAIEVTK